VCGVSLPGEHGNRPSSRCQSLRRHAAGPSAGPPRGCRNPHRRSSLVGLVASGRCGGTAAGWGGCPVASVLSSREWPLATATESVVLLTPPAPAPPQRMPLQRCGPRCLARRRRFGPTQRFGDSLLFLSCLNRLNLLKSPFSNCPAPFQETNRGVGADPREHGRGVHGRGTPLSIREGLSPPHKPRTKPIISTSGCGCDCSEEEFLSRLKCGLFFAGRLEMR